jgi:hypothetical protein
VQHPRRLLSVAVVATGLVLVGCESDQEVSSDPDGLESPDEAPEGADEDDGLDDAEDGTGEPAVEGDSEGRLEPGEDEEQ